MADLPNDFQNWGPKGKFGVGRAQYPKFVREVKKALYLTESPHCPGVAFPLNDARAKETTRG